MSISNKEVFDRIGLALNDETSEEYRQLRASIDDWTAIIQPVIDELDVAQKLTRDDMKLVINV